MLVQSLTPKMYLRMNFVMFYLHPGDESYRCRVFVRGPRPADETLILINKHLFALIKAGHTVLGLHTLSVATSVAYAQSAG